jgi:hypothetical protein
MQDASYFSGLDEMVRSPPSPFPVYNQPPDAFRLRQHKSQQRQQKSTFALLHPRPSHKRLETEERRQPPLT